MLEVRRDTLLFPPTKPKAEEFQLFPGPDRGPCQGGLTQHIVTPGCVAVLSRWGRGAVDSFLCSSWASIYPSRGSQLEGFQRPRRGQPQEDLQAQSFRSFEVEGSGYWEGKEFLEIDEVLLVLKEPSLTTSLSPNP